MAKVFHGTSIQRTALCGQVNAQLKLSPKEITCKRCRTIMGNFILQQFKESRKS